MIGPDAFLGLPFAGAVAAVIVIAGLAHGTLGFGFPIISTPVVAMMTDIRTAIIVTLFPNIVVNIVSVVRGGNWRRSIGMYWPITIYVLIGTVVGTRALIAVDPEPLKLLLAVMILVYLKQGDLRRLDWSWLERHRHASAMLFGLIAGFLAGAVNVTVPPLVIYFMALRLEALAMTQILNLCFLVGKSTQAVTLGIAGKIGLTTLVATLPFTVIAVTALLVGMRIQGRIQPQAYQTALRLVLRVMAVILMAQVAWHYVGSMAVG
jgi:uncharacterized membrane protein YfcA